MIAGFCIPPWTRQIRWELVVMSLYCMSETYGLRIECNYFLVAAAPLVLYGGVGAERKRRVLGSDACLWGGCRAHHVLD